MWIVYLAKMKYFCIGGELFFSAQAGDYVCAVKAAIAGKAGCFFVRGSPFVWQIGFSY